MSTTRTRGGVMGPAILAIATASGCASGSQVGKAYTPAGDPIPQAPPDQARGLHLEVPQLGFEHALQVRRSTRDVSRVLRDGASVRTGDRIRVSFTTFEDAFLYLAYCEKGKLTVYPSPNGIRAWAGRSMTAPERGGELVVDGQLGDEVLYVVLSRAPMSIADAQLTAALAAARPADHARDCRAVPEPRRSVPAGEHDLREGEPPIRDKALETHMSLSSKVLRGTVVRKKRAASSAGGRVQASPAHRRDDATSPSGPPDPDFERLSALPDPEFERSPEGIVWHGTDGDAASEAVLAADADGLAVVRYGFVHVATSSPP